MPHCGSHWAAGRRSAAVPAASQGAHLSPPCARQAHPTAGAPRARWPTAHRPKATWRRLQDSAAGSTQRRRGACECRVAMRAGGPPWCAGKKALRGLHATREPVASTGARGENKLAAAHAQHPEPAAATVLHAPSPPPVPLQAQAAPGRWKSMAVTSVGWYRKRRKWATRLRVYPSRERGCPAGSWSDMTICGAGRGRAR